VTVGYKFDEISLPPDDYRKETDLWPT